MPFQGARSGLKMGSWLPADAVTPWSVRGRPLVGHWELRFGPFIVAFEQCATRRWMFRMEVGDLRCFAVVAVE